MGKPTISAIVAIGKNRELGKNNDLIWRIPADLKRLKELTTGHAIIMGRKTYESIGHPLPNRLNIIVSRNLTYQAEGCVVVTSIEEALAAAKGYREICIFGGAAIYKLAWAFIDKLYLTIINDSDTEADTFFPAYADDFSVTKSYDPAEHDGVTYQWLDLARHENTNS